MREKLGVEDDDYVPTVKF